MTNIALKTFADGAADAYMAAQNLVLMASRRLREANDAQTNAEYEYRLARQHLSMVEAAYYNHRETVLAERARPDHR